MDRRTSALIRTILRASALAAACGVVVACSGAAPDRFTVSDWCWHHYRFAPPGALASDPGPESADEAVVWGLWLGSNADVPSNRVDAHREQRHLIDIVVRSGTWSGAERTGYRAASLSDPTPDTVCETVGARIVVADDGSLPDDWQMRFLDADDPAHSARAVDAYTAEQIGLDR